MVRYAVPAVGETAAELSSPLASGLGPQHAALSLNALAAELKPRADAAVHELATSGPDIAGTTRDTGVVLRELFAEAEHRVLVIGFAVQDGEIFAISRIGCVSGSISRCASASMSGPSPATRRGRTRCCARRGLRAWCGQALRTSRDVLVNTRKLARPRGVEPPTPRSVVWCSIQLSYGRVPRSLPACKGTQLLHRAAESKADQRAGGKHGSVPELPDSYCKILSRNGQPRATRFERYFNFRGICCKFAAHVPDDDGRFVAAGGPPE